MTTEDKPEFEPQDPCHCGHKLKEHQPNSGACKLCFCGAFSIDQFKRQEFAGMFPPYPD